MKKRIRLKLKNTVTNKSAKGKTYSFVETSDGLLVPRDSNYPLDAPGVHTKDGGVKG